MFQKGLWRSGRSQDPLHCQIRVVKNDLCFPFINSTNSRSTINSVGRSLVPSPDIRFDRGCVRGHPISLYPDGIAHSAKRVRCGLWSVRDCQWQIAGTGEGKSCSRSSPGHTSNIRSMCVCDPAGGCSLQTFSYFKCT